MEKNKIESLEQFTSLWQNIYNNEGKPSWDGILPYYSSDIYFKDSVQEIRGKELFTAMTRRLARRSKNLKFVIHNSMMNGNLIFMEWEMIMRYKNLPESSIYGASRITLRDGQVAQQRDYYDLWGDIYDNIPIYRKIYRAFMKKVFG